MHLTKLREEDQRVFYESISNLCYGNLHYYSQLLDQENRQWKKEVELEKVALKKALGEMEIKLNNSRNSHVKDTKSFKEALEKAETERENAEEAKEARDRTIIHLRKLLKETEIDR